jgi:prepilin-type N-terminal cleavage/methylation domain-containing protein
MHANTSMGARKRGDAGVTLVELMMTVLIFGMVMLVINNVFFSTNRLYSNTTIRAGQQMNARAAVSVMLTELRTAGCDPNQNGIVGILTAEADTVQVQADFDGDGAIQTAEPSETVRYYYDPALGAVVRDPGTGPQVMINDVTACTFTYFDVDNNQLAAPVVGNAVGLIRSIGINVTTTTDQGGDMVTDTRVSLRNG